MFPNSIRAGDTVAYTETNTTYQAPTYGATLFLSDATASSNYEGVANGSGWDFTIPAATSAVLNVGIHSWQVVATLGADRFTMTSGTTNVLPDLSAAPFDTRSNVKVTLDALEATLLSRATSDQEEMNVNGRSIKRTPLIDILALRDKYTTLYQQELEAERIANGGASSVIRVAFR
ncbi:MAG: hypothetical protein R8L53_10310 [Mariprofundales bacterium]